ncbi:MAG TPA: hypothetical protein VJ870_13520 [Amycolatopsis sp.]|nr:hypothetical protein [Amycolatopsis sp.]
MTVRKVLLGGVAVLAIGLGTAGCHGSTSSGSGSGSQSGADELSSVQTTLDAIDSELAGDGSP